MEGHVDSKGSALIVLVFVVLILKRTFQFSFLFCSFPLFGVAYRFLLLFKKFGRFLDFTTNDVTNLVELVVVVLTMASS